MNKWKAGIYLRLSSDDGDKIESNSITNQKNLIKLFVNRNKDISIKDTYIDDGYSGTDFERPDFKRMIIDIEKGKIDTIIVKDLSRFGRNYIEVGKYLEQYFPLYNLRFIAVNDNIDSYKDPDSINNIIVPFKNLMNDEYARDISNKVRSVLSTKRENGEFTGVVAPYGYIKSPKDKHKFIIDDNAAKVVKKIFKMALNGKSKREIIDELHRFEILTPAEYKKSKEITNYKKGNASNQWTPKKIDNILNNRAYIGELIQGKRKRISYKVHNLVLIDNENWVVVKNHHEPLIKEEDFNRVQNMIYKRDYRTKKNKEYDLFSGYLKCKDCMNSFTLKKAKNKEYYYCSSYIRNKECTKHVINKENLEKMVLESINKQIELIDELKENLDIVINESNANFDEEILNNKINDVMDKIKKYNKLKEMLIEDLNNKYISENEYIEYKNDYEKTIKKLEEKYNNIKNQVEKNVGNRCKSIEWINKFIKNKKIENLSRRIIEELIDTIFIHEGGNITIKFKYQDEYFEAIRFIKTNNCDIMERNVI